jgi:hypothetical protein
MSTFIGMTADSGLAAPQVQGSGRRSIHRKVDEVNSLADQLDINDFDDVAFAAKLAFEHANTGSGRGISFHVPPRIMVLKAPLRVPDRIVLIGSGMRDTIFHAQHDGPMFVFRDVEHAGLLNVRLGMGSRSGTQGIRIEARDSDVRRLTFTDIEIAGGGAAGSAVDGGQIGIQLTAAGRYIVSENAFDRLIFSEVDRPVIERSTEGNEWTRFVIDQFGYRGGVGFDSVANANHYQGRIAGAPGQGATGFRQGGYRNMMLLRVDIGNGAQALDLGPGTRNIVMLQRPAENGPPRIQTPLGRTSGSTIIDGDAVAG